MWNIGASSTFNEMMLGEIPTINFSYSLQSGVIKQHHTMKNDKKQRRLNYKELSLFRKYRLALDLLDEILANGYQSGDFKKIAINCKLYYKITPKDLKAELSKVNLQNQLSGVCTERDTKELFSTILDYEAQDFKDWIACHQTVKEQLDGAIDFCRRNWDSHPALISPNIDTTEDSLEDVIAEKIEAAASGIEIYERVRYLNMKDIIQIGKSNGWMSIADYEEFTMLKTEVSARTDETFQFDGHEVFVKQGAGDLGLTQQNAHEYVKSVIKKCRAVLWVLDQATLRVHRLTKEYVLSEIVKDLIDSFNESEVKITNKQLIAWQTGNYALRTNNYSNSYLRINPKDNRQIETSLGEFLPATAGKEIFERLNELNGMVTTIYHNEVGGGKCPISLVLDGRKKVLVNVGYHSFPWKHVETFAKESL